MWVQERWHIASLAAVFLSLGLGLMVGVAISQNPSFLDKQDQVIRQLATEVAQVRRVQDGLTRRLHDEQIRRQLAEQFSRGLAAWAAWGRLAGRPVCLIYDSPQAWAAADSLRQMLPVAGVTRWLEIQMDYDQPRVPWRIAVSPPLGQGKAGTLPSPSATVSTVGLPEATGIPEAAPSAGEGWSTFDTELRRVLNSTPLLPSSPAPVVPVVLAVTVIESATAVGQPVATGDGRSSSRATFHRQLLARLGSVGRALPLRLGLAAVGSPPALAKTPKAGPVEPADEVIWLWAHQGALAVNGMQDAASLATLFVGLSLPNAAGVFGLQPDGVMVPALPARAEADSPAEESERAG